MEKNKEKKKKYVLKRSAPLKILRCCIWTMLIFATICGIIGFIKPDKTSTLVKQVKNLREELPKQTIYQEECKSLGERFIMAYATYTEGKRDEFYQNLQPFIIKEAIENRELYDFKSSSRTLMATAYRFEVQTQNHVDVYVSAKIEQTFTVKDEESKEDKTIEKQYQRTYTYKVPIQIGQDGICMVESLPVIVNDNAYYQDETIKEVELDTARWKAIEEEEQAGIEEVTSNFLKALYTEKQSVIDYFLAPHAEKGEFQTLIDNNMDFDDFEEVKVFKDSQGLYLCQIKFYIKDQETNQKYYQECHLILMDSKSTEQSKYYIVKMGTKLTDLEK